MKIKETEENKNDYMNLLLDTIPDNNIVKKYLKDGDLYIGIVDDKVVGEIVITKYDENICELKNIAILSKYRRSELIKYVIEVYKTKYEKIIVE